MPMAANPEDATVPSPIAVATPVMISQIGLVRLPAATNASDGRRMASMNAHASTISAARASTSKNQLSTEYAPGLLNITLPGYLLQAATWNGTQRSAVAGQRAGIASMARASPVLIAGRWASSASSAARVTSSALLATGRPRAN